MLEKGQILEAEITDLNHLGIGVSKKDNFVIFVDEAINGDVAKIEIKKLEKNYAQAKLLDILKPSEHRITSPCQYHSKCGGCQLMNVAYEEQLVFKKNKVINELKRAKVNLEQVVIYNTIKAEEPLGYRNKTSFSVDEINNNIVIGPYEEGSYSTVDIERCLIQSDEANKTLKNIKELLVKYNIKPYNKKTHKGTVKNLVIRSNKNDEIMLIIVTSIENLPNKKELVESLIKSQPNIKTVVQNINDKNTNLAMGNKNIVLYGDGTINDFIGDLEFVISPETFFQVNAAQTEKLYATAIDYANIRNQDIIFDIYCGIGTISLLAAKHAKKVYGVEVVEKSIKNAKKNSIHNKITNTEFLSGKAEEVIPKLEKQKINPTTIIVDPPRKGCDGIVLDTIVKINPERIVYVSCNPQTLARDIKILETGGYQLVKVQPVDMFPYTDDVEAVTLLVRE